MFARQLRSQIHRYDLRARLALNLTLLISLLNLESSYSSLNLIFKSAEQVEIVLQDWRYLRPLSEFQFCTTWVTFWSLKRSTQSERA